MPRFFVNRENIEYPNIKIYGEDVRHIRNVLRMKKGDSLTLCDSQGMDFYAEIVSIENNVIHAVILASKKSGGEPPVDITLFQGLPKADKFELIIQKNVELGVGRIVPVITERTVVRLEDGRNIDRKLERWQKISLEAAKQCNRGRVPTIEKPVSFSKAVEMSSAMDMSLFPHENEKDNTLSKVIRCEKSDKIAIFIGPEGGFSEKEVKLACEKGIKPVTLGPRILRTETAGLAVISILMYEFGDIGHGPFFM